VPPRYPAPTLSGERVVLRPGGEDDVEPLRAILAESSVARWWAEPEPPEEILQALEGRDYDKRLVIEVAGEIAGGIQFGEEDDPMYRHATVDVFVGERFQGRGLGTEAVRVLAGWLFEERGHHRITIDPAAHNRNAIRAYEKVGFRPVGRMRQYEKGPDGSFHDGLLMDLLREELVR